MIIALNERKGAKGKGILESNSYAKFINNQKIIPINDAKKIDAKIFPGPSQAPNTIINCKSPRPIVSFLKIKDVKRKIIPKYPNPTKAPNNILFIF